MINALLKTAKTAAMAVVALKVAEISARKTTQILDKISKD